MEVARLLNTMSSVPVEERKPLLACFRIPEQVISDNRPQFSSQISKRLADTYGFIHVSTTVPSE